MKMEEKNTTNFEEVNKSITHFYILCVNCGTSFKPNLSNLRCDDCLKKLWRSD